MNSEGPHQFMEYFCFTTQSLVDSYLIVGLTIERLCGVNLVLKLKKLVDELHLTIKNLYAD